MVDDDEFELENDDFLAETFLSIPDSELAGSTVSEHSFESNSQTKNDVIIEQTESSQQYVSSIENREKENVRVGALNLSCDEDERLDKNIFSTLVSSTPLASNNKQKSSFIHSPDKESGNNVCQENIINSPSSEKKEPSFDFLKPNIKDKFCVKSDTSVRKTIENKPCHLDGSPFSNKLFSGVVSSAKKRKFSGPAGLLPATQDEALMKQPCSSGETRRSSIVSIYNDDYQQNIASSQYTPEALQCGPWKTLQADISSCLHNFSSSQNFTIRRILLESSKKKMPKYMVIPILCILIKKINVKDVNAKSVFMDETGEINGKIDKEVVEKYGKEIVEGSAVILRNVTSLCNVLILKCKNLVSIYMADGTVKQVQDLDSVLEATASVEDVACERLMPPKFGTANFQHSPGTTNISNKSLTVPLKTLNSNYKNSFKSSNGKMTNNYVSTFTPKGGSNHSEVINEIVSENENLDTNGCMDDFDELLGNLDETSFLDA